MRFIRSVVRHRCGAAVLAGSVLVLSVSAADTPPPESPIRSLVKRFTESRTAPSPRPPASPPAAPTTAPSASEPKAQSLSQPVAPPLARAPGRDSATVKPDTTRKPSPPLASLPAPKAASGPLRILLVDDDWSANNNLTNRARLSGSDEIFRGLVAAAVGGDASAWSVEVAPVNQHGPAFERLRDFNVVLWYTGGSYGGGADNVAVLSVEDEKTVKRYLEETGGAFILISPGYVSNHAYATSWTASRHPFLKEVAGINGLAGLVQRFAAGTVFSPEGARFNVEPKGAAETQFSAVNPDGAAVVFTSSLDPAKTAKEPVPVAVAHPYAGGRFVYVGFTFENIAEQERAKAFDHLLAAAVGSKHAAPAVAGPAVPLTPTPLGKLPTQPAPSLGGFNVTVGGTPARTIVRWTVPGAVLSLNDQVAQRSSAAPVTPAPSPSVTVEREMRGVYSYDVYWEPMVVPPDASEVVDGDISPGSKRKYRVTLTEANGATQSKEVEHTVPLPADPERITASLQGDYSVILTWPEVPGVTHYRVHHGFGSQVNQPTIVSGMTQWRSPPMDGFKRSWSVTSVYERDGEWISFTEPGRWPRALVQGIDQYFVVAGTVTIRTGNDNKELPSKFTIKLYINGGNTDIDPWNPTPNPLRLQDIGYSYGRNTTELKVNSSADFELQTAVDTVWSPAGNNLANIQQHGLRIVITYEPNFPLDAWKIDSVTLTLKFKDRDRISGQYGSLDPRPAYPPMADKTITFPNVSTLLTAANPRLDLVTDRFLMPIVQP